jgi:hypothetical protein
LQWRPSEETACGRSLQQSVNHLFTSLWEIVAIVAVCCRSAA